MLGSELFHLAAQVAALFAIPLSAVGILLVAGERALPRGAAGGPRPVAEGCRVGRPRR